MLTKTMTILENRISINEDKTHNNEVTLDKILKTVEELARNLKKGDVKILVNDNINDNNDPVSVSPEIQSNNTNNINSPRFTPLEKDISNLIKIQHDLHKDLFESEMSQYSLEPIEISPSQSNIIHKKRNKSPENFDE